MRNPKCSGTRVPETIGSQATGPETKGPCEVWMQLFYGFTMKRRAMRRGDQRNLAWMHKLGWTVAFIVHRVDVTKETFHSEEISKVKSFPQSDGQVRRFPP